MSFVRAFLCAAFLFPLALPALADDESAVRQADARYWQAFNTCDLEAMQDLFTEDVEFYHDKTGLTASKPAVIASLAQGPCHRPALHVRREEMQDSVRFHPLAGGFALLSGTHRFHATEAGKPERLDGQAQFTTLWQSLDGHWRMRRVISYAHGAVPYTPPATHMTLPAAALTAFAGNYRGKTVGDISVVAIEDGLTLIAGSLVVTLRAESPSRFFAVERDLRFEFSGGAGAKPAVLTVSENGNVVETAERVD